MRKNTYPPNSKIFRNISINEGIISRFSSAIPNAEPHPRDFLLPHFSPIAIYPNGSDCINHGELSESLFEMRLDELLGNNKALHQALITENIITTELGTVQVNPIPSHLKAFVANLPSREIRATRHNNDYYVWDAYRADHGMMRKKLGISPGPGFRLNDNIEASMSLLASHDYDLSKLYKAIG